MVIHFYCSSIYSGTMHIIIQKLDYKHIIINYSLFIVSRCIMVAKVIRIIMTVYLTQSTASVASALATISGRQSESLLIVDVWFSNFGGVLNALGFMWVQRYYIAVGTSDAINDSNSV